jgi:predicted transcriptional regulator
MNIFENITGVLKDQQLKPLDKLVYFALISFNGKGKCFPSLKAIGERINSNSITYISNSINKLKKMGFITIKRRRQLSNIYELNPITDKPEKKKKIKVEKVLTDEDDILKAEKEILTAYIIQIAYVIAGYRNETKPGEQIYKFINGILKSYSDTTVKNYQVAFMLLYYVLTCGDKFNNELPYSYFKSFFPMKYYSDFRQKVFNPVNPIKETEVYFN